MWRSPLTKGVATSSFCRRRCFPLSTYLGVRLLRVEEVGVGTTAAAWQRLVDSRCRLKSDDTVHTRDVRAGQRIKEVGESLISVRWRKQLFHARTEPNIDIMIRLVRRYFQEVYARWMTLSTPKVDSRQPSALCSTCDASKPEGRGFYYLLVYTIGFSQTM